MGREIIALVNVDNSAEFINYINARIKKLSGDRVAELIRLISDVQKNIQN